MTPGNASKEDSQALSQGPGLAGEPNGRLVAHFLGRLRQLVELKRASEKTLSKDGNRLVDKVIYSTFRDCQQLGFGEEAMQLLRGHEARPEESNAVDTAH